MTRIGVGGLIDMERIRQAHVVLNDISLFQHHAKTQAKEDKDEGWAKNCVFFFNSLMLKKNGSHFANDFSNAFFFKKIFYYDL